MGKIINNEADRKNTKVNAVTKEVETKPIRRFIFGDESRDPKLYKNARSEAYFKLADLIRRGHVILPDDDKLREEMAFCRYDCESTPLQLVDKKRLPRSPNRSDALVMLFWDFDFESLTAPPEDHSDLFSPTRQPRDREEYAAGPFDK